MREQQWSWRLRNLLSVPLIYGMAVPMAVYHVFLEIYHQGAFRLYAIPRVPMREYFRFDRHGVAGLGGMQKLQCFYCAYANGLAAYSREIIARTERYWCPMQHREPPADRHGHYDRFLPYGKGEAFEAEREKLREF